MANLLKSKSFQLIISFLISGALLYFVFKGLNLLDIVESFSEVNILYLVPLCLLIYLSVYIRALRWRHILPDKIKSKSIEYPTKDLFDASSIGIFFSWILPLRAGEFIRPWVLSQNNKISFTRAFASIVVERVFDVFCLLILFALFLPKIKGLPDTFVAGAWGLSVVSFALLVVIILAYLKGEFVLSIVKKVMSFLPKKFAFLENKILEMSEEFISGLKDISSFKNLCQVLFYSALLWLCFVSQYLLFIYSFGLAGSFIQASAVTAIVGISISLPSAPGFLGTYQFGCVSALTGLYGYAKELSVAYSVYSHAVQVLVGVLLGLYSIKRQNLSFSKIFTSLKKQSSS